MSAIKIIQAFAKKSLTKNQGSGITTLPSQFMAQEKAGQIALLLEKAGIPTNQLDDFIRSETDLVKYLNIIEAANKPTVYSGQAAMDQLNKLFPKKGEVFDLQGNKLNPNKPIMGGTQGIETLLKKGDVTKGTVSKKSDKVVEREMFEEANKKFNKTDMIADIVTKITSMEPVAAMKETNKIIKREGIYKNLDETQSQKILKDTDDWIFQRDPADLYDYKKNRPFRDDPNFDPDDPDFDPDQGYYTGGMVDVEPNLSDIGHGSDSLMARTRLISPNNQATTSTGLNYLLAEDNDNIRVPFAGGGSDRMMSNAEKEERAYNLMRDAMDREKFLKRRREEMEMDKKRLEEKKYGVAVAQGGRIGFADGNGVADEDAENAKFAKRVRELMDEGFDMGEAVREAMKEGYAEGGRIGFSKGKGVDLLRRGFLKAAGAAGAGIAALKTGLLGFGKQATKEVAKEAITTPAAAGKPAWFDALVTRVVNEGDDVTKKFATKDREIVHATKVDDDAMVTVYRDLDDGTVRVDIDDATTNVMDEQGNAIVSMQVKEGEFIEPVIEGPMKGKTGGKTEPSFEAVETDYRNYMDGPDDFVTEGTDNTVDNIKNLTADLTKVKMYAKGQKKPTIKEMMIQRDRAKTLKQAEENPAQYAADRGPDIDTKDYDYASGGIARMIGE